VVELLRITLTKIGQRGLTLGDCDSFWFQLSDVRCCGVVVGVVSCVLICSDSVNSFSVIFVGVGVCVYWVVVVPMKSLSARLSARHMLVLVVGKGRWHPWVFPARSVLEGEWRNADDAEERGLSVVASMVIMLRASLILAYGL